ncbi:hypothetical protein MYCTH_2301605 [Thermothelomyces thermophilus ATCC 42464]|uniref:Uncharacterized protein n=1 Tax=Thermothelomyces thermophilus (strain ATCC 42464 / BCRC 31852 / DSM 1799) TaxID=573729 RepID=G2Q9S8_THET4|nr:uncharacterized protein MYCTH_2301605 [Thermothelomyces thermophilus ATCC 42464]AEO56537.1 hypothetical protein MYCTH_2301605 [Thermothelomyces thermophilus ATCC 42464]
MAKFQDQYTPPGVSIYGGYQNYAEWKFTLFLHLDWYDLRSFVVDTVAAPAPDATDKERLAYKRKKIMSYAILRDSVREWLEQMCTNYEFHGPWDGPKPGCHCMALRRVLEEPTTTVYARVECTIHSHFGPWFRELIGFIYLPVPRWTTSTRFGLYIHLLKNTVASWALRRDFFPLMQEERADSLTLHLAWFAAS